MSELHRKFDSLAGYITFMEVLDSKFVLALQICQCRSRIEMSTEPPQMHHKYLFEQQ